MPGLDVLAARYALVLALCGLLGVALGLNRTIKRREKESLILRLLSTMAGVVVLALPTLMVLDVKHKGTYTAATLLLMIVLSLCLLARPLKKIPMAFTVVTAAGAGLLWAALKFRSTSLGGRIPIELIVGTIVLLLAALLVLCFAVEAFVDTVLTILGLGLVVTMVSAVAAVHGALIAQGVTGPEGLEILLR